MVDELLANKLAKVKYDAEATPELVKTISHEILFEVKSMFRYRLCDGDRMLMQSLPPRV